MRGSSAGRRGPRAASLAASWTAALATSRRAALDAARARREIAVFDTGGRVNEETFNLSIRKFLKMVGINSQREIERAVAAAREAGRIGGSESFPAHVTLRIDGLDVDVRFDGEIQLE
jgi:hypothetical protein